MLGDIVDGIKKKKQEPILVVCSDSFSCHQESTETLIALEQHRYAIAQRKRGAYKKTTQRNILPLDRKNILPLDTQFRKTSIPDTSLQLLMHNERSGEKHTQTQPFESHPHRLIQLPNHSIQLCNQHLVIMSRVFIQLITQEVTTTLRTEMQLTPCAPPFHRDDPRNLIRQTQK